MLLFACANFFSIQQINTNIWFWKCYSLLSQDVFTLSQEIFMQYVHIVSQFSLCLNFLSL